MRVFITGLSGSLGTALAALHHSRGDTVWGCARSEATAVRWLADHWHLATLYVCDAADLAKRCTDAARLLPSMDRVYHCAAMKHVDLCEQQPEEATYQNVVLAGLVAGACHDAGVPLVFAGTDKACMPSGVYGATKLIAERITMRLGGAVVRLGNLVGSSGSVFARWREQAARGAAITLTDPDMTRYFIGVDEAARFMADLCRPECVTIPRGMKAVRMGDVARVVSRGDEVRVIGRRPGESLHQWLISPDEAFHADPERFVLDGEGSRCHAGGISSQDAPPWDVGELLALAGVKEVRR